MNFQLYDHDHRPLFNLVAKNEKEAWQKIKNAGIRNKSNIFSLVEIHD
jgi:hypothetical protein